MTASPLPDTPAWVARLYPEGVPYELGAEIPMSDKQASYLAYLGHANRWCSMAEASWLIDHILHPRRQRARARRKVSSAHPEGTP